MITKCCSFAEMAEDIKANKRRIVLFGAGVIGQVTVPEIAQLFSISSYFDCYLDNDSSRWGSIIEVNGENFEVKSPEYLKECEKGTVLFITISRFSDVIEQLEKMDCTKNMTAYIMPMMLIHNFCSYQSKGLPVRSEKPLIPKVINYMWLGKKPIPDVLQKCIDSWRKKCPDYEIKEWNENNYDIEKHPYMKQAYERGAYGFVPDYARLDILYNCGGFYLDTDVELIKSLDDLRFQEAFVGVEKWQIVNFGGCSGAIKGQPVVKALLDNRKDVLFADVNGKINKTTCGYYDTKVILNCGYKIDGTTQCINGMNVYAYDYFHPYDYMSGITQTTDNTISIHHFNGGWLDDNMKEQNTRVRKSYLELYNKCLVEGI